MRIGFNNLPALMVQSVNEDMRAVRNAAERDGVLVPQLQIHLVSLEQSPLPAGLPGHEVSHLSKEPPSSYEARCRWELTRQSFELIAAEGVVWCIGGGDSGAYYGFLEALEALMGVIFSGENDADILFKPPKALPARLQQPALAFRARDGLGTADHESFLRWLGRNRYNLWRQNSVGWTSKPVGTRRKIISACKARGIQLTLGDHAISLWLPETEFETHPEWFGMRDNQRVRRAIVHMPECPHLSAELPIQPCYSNESLQEYMTDQMAAHVAQHPEISMFGLWPHDGINNWCQCPNCRQKKPIEQILQLALRLEKKIPRHVLIELIAYSNLLNLPQNCLTGHERVLVLLCPYLRHYKHRIYDSGLTKLSIGVSYPDDDRINPTDDREYGALFRIWGKFCRQSGLGLGIFEYGATFYDETGRVDRPRYFYHPPINVVADEIQWYCQHQMHLFYLCGYYRGWPDRFHEVALAALMWNGGHNVDGLAQAYYQALAGKEGVRLRESLKAVSQRLLLEETPQEELRQFRAVLKSLPEGKVKKRYQLWADYVEMGREVRDLMLAEHWSEAIAMEDKIAAFLEQHQSLLQNCLTPGALKYGQINQKRCRERLRGCSSSDYLL